MTTPEITDLLQAWRRGESGALDRLTARVYADLHALAERALRNEARAGSLQPTDLLHELFLRLPGTQQIDWQDRAHFRRVAAVLVRQILVDRARRRTAEKRGGGALTVVLEEMHASQDPATVDVLAIHQALDELAALDARKAEIIQMRHFGGMSQIEIGEVMGIHTNTVLRDLRFAEAWLRSRLVRD